MGMHEVAWGLHGDAGGLHEVAWGLHGGCMGAAKHPTSQHRSSRPRTGSSAAATGGCTPPPAASASPRSSPRTPGRARASACIRNVSVLLHLGHSMLSAFSSARSQRGASMFVARWLGAAPSQRRPVYAPLGAPPVDHYTNYTKYTLPQKLPVRLVSFRILVSLPYSMESFLECV